MNKKYSLLSSIVTKIVFALLLVLTIGLFLPIHSQAKDLDEIVNYQIRVDVNEDATLHMIYHIDWKVLDSTSEGPLSWVLIGIPNNKYKSYKALSKCIKTMSYSSTEGALKITLDRNYKAGEIVPIEFELVQDYMYQMDMLTEGETVYEFTPGWFDDIKVDNLEIYWNSDKAISHTPASDNYNNYFAWKTSLGKGQKYKVSVTYPNDAFKFDTSKKIKKNNAKFHKFLSNLCPIMMVVMFFFGTFALYYFFSFLGWVSSSGFKGTSTKVVRTVVEYMTNCPNCGAPRQEGKEVCSYCGRKRYI